MVANNDGSEDTEVSGTTEDLNHDYLAKDSFIINIISNTIRPKRQNAIKLINVQVITIWYKINSWIILIIDKFVI